jgi:PRTRC genetic system protein B
MMTKKKPVTNSPGFSWAVPEELGIPPDPLRLRLDFFHQAVEMTTWDGETQEKHMVDAIDIAHALARELSFGTGLLPANTLWWKNTRSGPVFALYEEPRMRKVALQLDIKKPAKRFNIPMPGLVFLCMPGQAPYVFAVTRKPTKETDKVYRAPLLNVHHNGRSCPGTHNYPTRVGDMVNSFFISFFSNTADLANRSKKFPKSVAKLWDWLDKGKMQKYPVEDLIQHGTVRDLLEMEVD